MGALRELLDEALEQAKLTEREHRVLAGRLGLAGETVTLAALGRELGVTRERIRQIEGEALRKLRVVKMVSFRLERREVGT